MNTILSRLRFFTASLACALHFSAPAASAGEAGDPVAEATAQLSAISTEFAAMKPGDTQTARRLMQQLAPIGARLGALPDKTSAAWKAAAATYNNLNTSIPARARTGASASTAPRNPAPTANASSSPSSSAGRPLSSLEQTQFNRLSRDIARSISIVAETKEPDVLNAANVQNWRTAAENHRTNLGNLGRSDRPEVAALGPEIDRLVALIDERVAGATGSRQSLGDFEARLTAIEKNYSAQPVPAPEAPPLVAAEMRAYATRLQSLREQTAADLAYLQKLAPSPFAPANMSSRIHWQQQRADEIAKSLQATRSAIDNVRADAARTVAFVASSERDARLGNEDLFSGLARQLGEAAANLEGALALYETLGDTAAAQAVRTSLAAVTAEQPRLEKRFEQAVAGVRLPKPVSTDAALLRAARTAIAAAGYDASAIAAVAINAPLKRLEKKEGEVNPGVAYTRITVYSYAWDQFQVTTAEKVGDRHYLFYNTLKYFHSGAPTTPTGRWVLADRIKGSPILKQNLP